MMLFLQKNLYISFVIALLALSNCSKIERENFVISQSLIDSPSSVTLVEVSGFEEPRFYRGDQAGLLDCFVNGVFGAELRESIKYIAVKKFIQNSFYQKFAAALKKAGFTVLTSKPIDRESLKAPKNETAEGAPYDFSPLSKQYKSDYLMVLDPLEFGIRREYYSFIPTSSPYGHTFLRVYLVDLKTNILEGYFATRYNVATSDKWDDQGARYEEVTNAAEKSVKEAINAAYGFFFDNFFHQMHLKVKAGEIEAPQ